MPGMVETKDLAQLRQLNLELLRQLWVGQDAMRQLVAKAASESSLDSSSSCDSEMPLSPKTPSMAQRTSSPRDANQGDSCGMSSLGASSGVTSLPPVREPRSPLRPCGAPLLATSDSSDSERSAELEAQVPRSLQDQPRKLPKLRVTFNKESPVPERSWRLRPYLGYDWIAGVAHPMHTPCLVSGQQLAHRQQARGFLLEAAGVPGDPQGGVYSQRARTPVPRPAGERQCPGRPRMCVLLPCQPASVPGAFGPWHPLPPVQDSPGPAGPYDTGRPSAGPGEHPTVHPGPTPPLPHPPAEELRHLRYAVPAPALPAGLGHSPSKTREKLRPPEPGPLVLCHLRGPAPAAVGRPFPPGPVSAGPVPHPDLVRTPGAPAPPAHPGGRPEDWPLGGQCSCHRFQPLPSGRGAHEKGALPGLS
ncbi:migration and invasion-inhibitory protein isoform X2 [Myotis daubentonii]|uniref:migration and invasion-inhibitory protein isoform X2 n=1 Tax=Myotis daubentonii TaxID=98922 RepID=UPI002872F81B|nr:migration and invasion-inhibitory protein isoform X2 [Myotis daubentonii]